MAEKVKSRGVLQTERSLLLDCISTLKRFKVNEDTELKLESVYRFLEINNLSDVTNLETAILLLREDEEDDYLLDEVEDLINETILDLEFLVQQRYNKI
jgi:hypothetical protein